MKPLAQVTAVATLACWYASGLAADWQPIARQLPPPGLTISDRDREELAAGLARLEQRIEALPSIARQEWGADVEIYSKAVRLALEYSEFYRKRDVEMVQELMATAHQRLDELARGGHSWSEARGLAVRGYQSRIDGSYQPYGVVVPESLEPGRRVPLFVWLHGRNDKLTDAHFLDERQRNAGQLKLDNAVVLHPFGRSCLGWKSTAEIDVLEAIQSVLHRYPVDPDRVVLMGFSMGGAGAWHMGAHYADQWAAVHAGAGFVDVARYTRLAPVDFPPVYEQKLWGLYDVPGYVRNLFNLPVVAYSGEVDKQKDAADFMAETYQQQGQTLTHLIGPGMAHQYDEAVWRDVVQRMQAAASKGREPQRANISLQTRTLRYNNVHWVAALGLEEHWQDSRIDARREGNTARLDTKNVTALRLSPAEPPSSITIDGQDVPVTTSMHYERQDGRWAPLQESADKNALRKRPELQGPIDDVLMTPFLVVLPSAKSRSAAVQKWVDFEWNHFRERWQAVYRGTLRVRMDVDVTPSDIEQYSLIAWGDRESNQLIDRVADRLPIQWNGQALQVGEAQYDAAEHLPLLIYPNPLNPANYLVLNSGPTHREAHDRTNSLQNPKLPDWAILKITAPPDATRAGTVSVAGFFDERWQLRAATTWENKP